MKGNFQIITIVVFIALGVIGILVFSGTIPLGEDNDGTGGQGTVVLWGTIDSSVMSKALESFNGPNSTFRVEYVQKSSDTFDQQLLEAIASGTGPDFFFLPDNLVLDYANKITVIPYQNYPLANFKNTFAGAGEVFLSSKGILAFPILIDPLVMYYNRSMLDASGIVSPPLHWDEFLKVSETLTKRDESNKIIKSGAALGHYANVAHAKDIVATLFMQTGNPIVSEVSGVFSSALFSNPNQDLSSALQFYIDFADPLKSAYSWSRSFPNSADAFSSEDLAFYFGYGSELPALVNKNPNHNFFVASIPQIKGAKFKLTGSRVTGIAVSASSRNFNTAFLAASQMASGDFAKKLAEAGGVAPARRNLLSARRSDAYSPIFYNSAIFAKSWLDPSDRETDNIFRGMIDGALSGNLSTREAVLDAGSRLRLLLLK